MVGNVIEILDIGEDSDEEEDGAAKDVNSDRKGIAERLLSALIWHGANTAEGGVSSSCLKP